MLNALLYYSTGSTRTAGQVRLQDAREALEQLVLEPRRFDAIVIDITDTVLKKTDVEHLYLAR